MRYTSPAMGLLTGKRGLIVGIANERSLATGIARAARAAGADLARTYQTHRLVSRVRELADELGSEHVLPCELTRDDDVRGLAAYLTETWGRLDFLVHAVAFARREELEGRFLDTSRDGFAVALDV